MNIVTCVICSKPFPYRKGKQYCSNSCKQQGYNNKKSGQAISGIADIQVKRKIFYVEDFKAFRKENPAYDNITLMQYFFAIKNFGENESIEFLNYFAFELLTDEFIGTLKKESHPVGRQFLQFQNEFHLGNYVAKDQRKVVENLEA